MPHNVAFKKSPKVPFRKFLPSLPSFFMCPMCGSIACRLLIFLYNHAVEPLLVPEIWICTFRFPGRHASFWLWILRQLITDKAIQSCILNAAIFLKTPRRMDEVSSFLKNTGHNTETIQGTLNILCENFLIQEDLLSYFLGYDMVDVPMLHFAISAWNKTILNL
jgi:hypothetical protein